MSTDPEGTQAERVIYDDSDMFAPTTTFLINGPATVEEPAERVTTTTFLINEPATAKEPAERLTTTTVVVSNPAPAIVEQTVTTTYVATNVSNQLPSTGNAEIAGTAIVGSVFLLAGIFFHRFSHR